MWMESGIFWQEDGFPGQFMEFLFASGSARVDGFGDVPVVVGAGGDDVAVHGPVVVFAESEAVGRMVVVACRERDEMGGVDERDIVARGQANAESAGGALVVVNFEDLAAERGRAAEFRRLVADERWWIVDRG